jgi:hypothetical protein
MASKDSTDGSSPGVSLLKEDDYGVIVNNLIDDYFGVGRVKKKKLIMRMRRRLLLWFDVRIYYSLLLLSFLL